MDRQLIRREIAAVALTLASAFIAGAVVLQRSTTALCQDATGPFGPFGTAVRCLLIGAVGIPGALVMAAGTLAVALSLFGRLASQRPREWAWLVAGVVALLPIGIGLVIGGEPRTSDASGVWGTFVAHYLRKGLGVGGAWIAFLLAVSALTVVTLRWNPIRVLIGARDRGPAEGAPDGMPGARTAPLTVAERLAPDHHDRARLVGLGRRATHAPREHQATGAEQQRAEQPPGARQVFGGRDGGRGRGLGAEQAVVGGVVIPPTRDRERQERQDHPAFRFARAPSTSRIFSATLSFTTTISPRASTCPPTTRFTGSVCPWSSSMMSSGSRLASCRIVIFARPSSTTTSTGMSWRKPTPRSDMI